MEPVRVMVVDDAADARFLITLILREQEDIEVVVEADGASAALEEFEAADPAVALVDARMPVIDGFELTERLRADRPGLLIAILTSVVDEVIEARARAAGADACWSKADLEDLPTAIRELVASALGG